MTQRERDRLVALNKADKRLITQKQAAQQIGLSERQVRRLLAKLRSQGDRAVIHAARGRASNRKISAKVEKQAVAILSKPLYASFGPTLAAEYLQQRHGIRLGRETLRGWMAAAGLWKPRRRNSARPHLWRPRRSCRGELVQWDTSEHDWLEERGEKLYLIGMIDDASSELLARFVGHDSSEENRRLPRTYLEKNGRPAAFYTDRASLFVNTPKNSAGEDPKTLPPTQIGRALEELGIESITAYSPQAKGRVERSFGTAQDRLVKGLRVAGASTIKQANAYLESEFLPWWNATLRVQPAHPDEAHRELGPEHDLDSALSHVETRRVANDYTIRFQGKLYQIDRKAIVPGLRGGKVRLESRLDASLVARFGKHELALKRCHTGPQSGDSKKQAAATAAEKAPRQAPRRKGSDWMEGFDLKKSPPLWQAARASGARRPSRCLSPRPQLRDSTKAMLLANTAAAGSGPHGKPALTASQTANGWALPTVQAGAKPRLEAQQGGIRECSNTKPSDREARGPCRSADCFGASPVASALGMESRRDPALHSQHFTIASLNTRPKPDISTWQRIGHFYLALTSGSGVWRRERQ